MGIKTHPVLWIDFETGGFEPDVHSPLSFAMLHTQGAKIINEWYTQIRQEPFVVTREALSVNKLNLLDPGLTYIEFKSKYWERMDAWFFTDESGRKIKANRDNMPFFGGQNCPFDRGFLRQVLDSKFDGCNYISKDLLQLAIGATEAGYISPENYKLGEIARVCNIKTDGELHNALTDVKVTFACWQRLIEMMER